MSSNGRLSADMMMIVFYFFCSCFLSFVGSLLAGSDSDCVLSEALFPLLEGSDAILKDIRVDWHWALLILQSRLH
jgi:hypothetical protein